MDTSSDENTWIFDSEKRLKMSDENKDFISDLPDQILVHILSFLPLKDAINTLLLRRFGNLWCSITVLDIDYCLYHECDNAELFYVDEHNKKFTDIIQNVLNLRDSGPLDKLVLNFNFARSQSVEQGPLVEDYLEKYTAEQIEKLIRFAIGKNVKILDLSLKGCWSSLRHSERYELPNVFTSCYLTKLYLTSCDLRPCVTIDLKLLKVLSLYQVLLSDDIMENILISCPSLENLSVDKCDDLNMLICENPNLKKVRVSTWKDPLFLSCPYVSSLEIDGWIERIFLLDDLFVGDVSIKFSDYFGCENRPYRNVSSLLQMFCKSKTLNLCTMSILVLRIQCLTNVPCPSFFCKKLILGFGLTKWQFPGLASLLRSSPSIETLTINFSLPGKSFFTTARRNWIQSHDFDGDSYWDSQEAMLPHLETILIYGYRKKTCMIKLVGFLLKSAQTLHKMVITTTKNREVESEFTSQELQELSQELLRLPRASSQAIVCVS